MEGDGIEGGDKKAARCVLIILWRVGWFGWEGDDRGKGMGCRAHQGADFGGERGDSR